ncbi:MAG: SDR family NAD(P)-dependent oxidoreductase [Myxococcales bacterium]|nr:SDR family NAD(P)-dependent oxidoreductase [Myxococcales bacterium]
MSTTSARSPQSPIAPPTKRALVTGANRGIGRELSRQLCQRGYEVWLAARDLDAGAAAAAAICDRHDGAIAHALQLDVADAESVRAAAATLARDGVILDALVNNAGVALDGFNADVVRRTLAINTDGALAVSDALRPRLRDGACLVMVSSGMGSLSCYSDEIAARFGNDDITRADVAALCDEFIAAVQAGEHARRGWPTSAYRVSKAALNALTRIIAREQPALRVNAVCPGWVRTEMGGAGAERGVDEGARSVLWAATLPPDGPSGGFYRDGEEIPW